MTYVEALAITLAVELPIVAWAYGRRVGWRRALATGTAVNLATHGALWAIWPLLGGAYWARVAGAECVVCLVEAGLLGWLLGGRASLAAGVSVLANGLSTTLGTVFTFSLFVAPPLLTLAHSPLCRL